MENFKKILKYFKKYKLLAILAPCFKLLEASFELLVPLIVSRIIEDGIKKQNSKLILIYFIVLIAFSIIGILCALVAQYFSAECASKITKDLRKELFCHYQNLSMEDQNEITTPKIINLMNNDMNQVQNAINLFLRLFLRAPIIVFGSLLMSFIISKKISLIFLALIPILIIFVYFIMTKSVPLFSKAASMKDKINKKTMDNLTGSRVIRSFNKQSNFINEFNLANEELLQNEIKASNFSILLSPLTSFVINLGIIAIIYFGGLEVKAGSLEQGDVVALYNYMSNILVEIIKLTNLFITLSKGIASFKRIDVVLNKKTISFKNTSINTNDNDAILEMNHVHFSYQNAQNQVLKDIHFTASKNDTIGIIGGTGSGKSTLLDLIQGLYQATNGLIYLYGKDIVSYNKEDLNKLITIALQKPELFQGSIRDNISFGTNYSDEEIINALHLSEAYDFVFKKENNIDYLLTKNASNCSGGEKQRLSLARAFIRKSKILLIDDSFSSLDYLTDKKIRNNIKQKTNYDLLIITSQRISSIQDCTKIIVLNNGEIEAIGTHEELLIKSNTYHNIYQLQISQKGKEKNNATSIEE